MRTALRIIILKSVLMLSVFFHAQAQYIDTTYQTKIINTFWTKERLVPKIGAGVQDRPFLEVGVYLQNIYWHPLTWASKGPYLTVDLFVDRKNYLFGPKLGYEITAGIFGVAFDVTYFIDHNYDQEGSNRRAFAATPKAGISILGFVDLFYGYQIPLSEKRIPSIDHHRVSLTFNLNRDYFRIKEAPRKHY